MKQHFNIIMIKTSMDSGVGNRTKSLNISYVRPLVFPTKVYFFIYPVAMLKELLIKSFLKLTKRVTELQVIGLFHFLHIN